MQHVLSLEIPDTLNKCVLRVIDTSVYANMPISCTRLEITPPGFIQPVTFENIQPGFMFNLTACDMQIQTELCGTTYSDLQDGIYIIRYSLSPNNIVYVEYNHLRITCALNQVYEYYCKLDIYGCEPSSEIKKKLEELIYIEGLLKAAKAKVEICHEPNAGMDIYNYAMILLSKLNCNKCNKC